MDYQITVEGRKSIAQIQKDFESKLGSDEILTSTARALNDTATRVQGFIRKEVRKNYTMNKKYLDRMSQVRKYAKGEQSGLYAEVVFRYKPIPMIAFNHSPKRRNGGVWVNIKKGKGVRFKRAFIASMRNTSKGGEASEHEGIFAAGRYVGKEFIYDGSRTASGKVRITELKTASTFTMSTGKELQPKIRAYVDKNLPSRLSYFLQKKIDKLIE
jgi:hypothetical protein